MNDQQTSPSGQVFKLSLRQAHIDDLDQLEPLVSAYHDFEHVSMSASRRRQSLSGLLNQPESGVVWLILVDQVPVGYIAICFGYSIEFQGRDGYLDEFYIEPEWRGKGIGTQVLSQIKHKARELQVKALYLEVASENLAAISLYQKQGFSLRDRYHLMAIDLDAE